MTKKGEGVNAHGKAKYIFFAVQTHECNKLWPMIERRLEENSLLLCALLPCGLSYL